MTKLGIHLNLRRIDQSNEKLLRDLDDLRAVDPEYLSILVNITGDKSADTSKFSYLEFINTTSDHREFVTNRGLRGTYRLMNCEYVLFIDDDFTTEREGKIVMKYLKSIVAKMDSNPLITLIRFKYNSIGTNPKYSFISSTSLSSGLLVRNRPDIFREYQLDFHWRTDDASIILNSAGRGLALDASESPFRHHIAGSAEDLTFTKDIYNKWGITGYEPREYLTDIRPKLISKLTRLRGTVGNENPKVIVNAHSSILRGVPSSWTQFYGRDQRRNIGLIGVIKGVTHFIVAAGRLDSKSDSPEHNLDTELSITRYNIECMLAYVESLRSEGRKGTIIIMGSTASEIGYPTRPSYAAGKCFLKSYAESLELMNSDVVRVIYLTIPSTVSDMCTEGVDSEVVRDSIVSLVTGEYNG